MRYFAFVLCCVVLYYVYPYSVFDVIVSVVVLVSFSPFCTHVVLCCLAANNVHIPIEYECFIIIVTNFPVYV